ncbi:methyl-accepting chemotaxis protein [Noviherbaspirillum galbum]|uniref:HAMP domain-containing protein n=1 Tax=Noviherbaspirillum galbum TaxID=2709383 RepID=A0A6B3SIA7_9BURK|nr:methyl-accepting chemotaxis protein [Noviherbaspirillum galbum]NEX60551.1 HAMP domain-containing protein [Noviherbaspirillum galbum]
MLKDLSIRNRLYIAFGIIVALLLLLLLSAIQGLHSLSEANKWDRHTLQVLLEADKLEIDVFELQAQYRGFLLTGNDRFLERLPQNEQNLRETLATVRTLVKDNPAQLDKMARFETAMQTWLNKVVHPLVAQRRSLGAAPNAADQAGRGLLGVEALTVVNDMRAQLRAFDQDEQNLLEYRQRTAQSTQDNVYTILIGGGIACVVLAILVTLLLARSLLRPLESLTQAVTRFGAGQQDVVAEVHTNDELGTVASQFNQMTRLVQEGRQREHQQTTELRTKVDSLLTVVERAARGDLTGRVDVKGDDAIGQLGAGIATMLSNLRTLITRVQKAGIQVTTSTTEIAASAKQQEATGVEQAQTSIEVLSTTKEISANTAQLVKTMEEITRVADYTTTATGEAQNGLVRMDHTMQHMVSATESINAKLAALSEKASNITTVLTTITKVADQTNILSLNAAIEAEKAGEAGRGFSVVATEIRRLADQTSVATWDIDQMLKEMQAAVSASVMSMDKFLEEIRRSVGDVRNVGTQLSGVIEQVQKLTPRFDLVLEGMQSQAVGASQITETMSQLNEASQQAVDALKSTSEAVQQLQYAAQDLQSSVSTFAVNL